MPVKPVAPPYQPVPPRLDPRYAIPRVAPEWVRRTALVDLLHESAHRKVILVSAAAGYGKTSLLATFAAESVFPVAWLRLGEDDRDVAALAGHIVGALQTRFPAWRSSVMRLASQAGVHPADLGSALAREMGELQDGYFVLVLDDFHLPATEPAVIALFNALVTHLPEQAHLIIAGRSLPQLNYAQLIAQDQLTGLDESRLRFSPEDVQALFQTRNQLDVPRETAQELVDNTEGWITGILLTSHLLWQGLVAKLIEAKESNSPIFEYLATEVLERQPPDLQQFLLESSVLPDMEPDVCDAALGRDDSAQRLRQAQARRLFISAVGEDTPAYQYHNLFRDFLRQRLMTQNPARLQAIQVQAARWYANHEMPEAALTFYVQAGDLETAAQLAEAEARRLYELGRFATLRQWSEQLVPVAERVPRLFLYVATADLDSGRLNRAMRALDQADAGFAAMGQHANRISVEVRRCMVLNQQGKYAEAEPRLEAVVRAAEAHAPTATQALALRHLGNCYMWLGKLTQAESALLKARTLYIATDDTFSLALALIDLSHVYRNRGKSALASQTQQEALSILRTSGAAMPLINLLNNIGWDMYMLGEYEAAMSTYAEALEWTRRSGIIHLERPILEGQATILADLGDTAGAAALYHQLLQQTEDANERHILIYVCSGLARLDRRAGNFASALEWIRRAELYQKDFRAALPMANIAGLHGMLQVELGHLETGLAELRHVAHEQEQAEAMSDQAQTLLFCACAEFRMGQVERAVASLDRAFQIAETVGYEQMLLREVPMVADLLQALRAHPVVGVRIEGLLGRAAALPSVRTRLAARGVLTASEVPAPPSAGLEVHSLGGARVFRDGVEIPRNAWGAQRSRDLFFFLVDNMPVSRDVVLATFWPEMAQARAAANLYQTLYRLRKALGADVVVLEPDQCRPADGLTLLHDAAEFEIEAKASLAMPRNELRRLGTLDSAARRYAGPYLPEVDMPWADQRRDALHELFVKVLLHLADEHMRYTKYADARAVLERALATEPLHDEFHTRMLTCLAALGRRHEVVDHYRRYRETLRNELGLDPPVEIRQLYARLIG